MADFPRYEFQGRSDCPLCGATAEAQWKIQDWRGQRIGRRVEKYVCCCPGNEGREGKLIIEEEAFTENCQG